MPAIMPKAQRRATLYEQHNTCLGRTADKVYKHSLRRMVTTPAWTLKARSNNGGADQLLSALKTEAHARWRTARATRTRHQQRIRADPGTDKPCFGRAGHHQKRCVQANSGLGYTCSGIRTTTTTSEGEHRLGNLQQFFSHCHEDPFVPKGLSRTSPLVLSPTVARKLTRENIAMPVRRATRRHMRKARNS